MFRALEGPLLLVVLDGVGEISRIEGNAVRLAHMPFWNDLKRQSRFRTLRAHGTAVGLPTDADMGNSEVGHNALGSGQIYDQGAKLVNEAIASGALFSGPVWNAALEQIRQRAGVLHFIGLLSDGNVHSHIDHLLAMIDTAASQAIERLRVHVLLDGRDVGGTTAHLYLQQLETRLEQHRQAGRDYRIASGGGRMFLTMDRYDADWSMVQRGWEHHVRGQGRFFPDALTALQVLREEKPGILDQDLPGFVIGSENTPNGPIRDGDSVIFFNFRGDRALEITRAFEEGPTFDRFPRGPRPDVFYAGMMQYDGDLHLPTHFLVGPPRITHTLTEVLATRQIRQYAISETQKFGHVTYFWNGNRSGKIDPQRETYVEIPSDNLPFQFRPWMKAPEITDVLIEALQSGNQQFLRVNYANGDMVGHTGDLDAAVIAMSCLDWQLRRLLLAVRQLGGVALVTADHGNCDEMYELDKQGKPLLDREGKIKVKTSHTLSPVPFLLYDPADQVPFALSQSPEAGIASLAPTVAQLLGITPPSSWVPSLLDGA